MSKDKNVTIVQEIQSDPYTMTGDKSKLVTRNLDEAEGGSIKEIIPILDEQYTEGDGALEAMKLASPGAYKAMDENRTLAPFLLKYDDILSRQEAEVDTFLRARNQEAFNEYDINESYFETAERFADEIDEIKGRFTLEKENALREALGDDFFDAGNKYYSEAVRKLPRAEAGDWFTDNVKFGIQTAVKNDSPYVLLPKNDRALVKAAGDSNLVLTPNQLKYFEDHDYWLENMSELRHEEDSMYPLWIQEIFGWDNETLWSVKNKMHKVPNIWLTEEWHHFMDTDCYVPKNTNLIHVINKEFDWVRRWCDKNNIQPIRKAN